MGRWISADNTSNLGADGTLTGYNLFAYCANNPVNKIDIMGEVGVTIGLMAIGGLIGAGLSAISSAVTQYAATGEVNWKSVAVSGASGFVSGALAASPLGISGQRVAGGIIGGVSYMVDSYVNDKAIEVDMLLISTGAGAFSGHIGGNGANVNHNLSRAIQTSKKTISDLTRRSCLEYARKNIASNKNWIKNILSINTWEASTRFSIGLGTSNGLINAYDKWFR